ncbi:AP2 domain-containing protein [Streptococcus pyogenes]|uniref:AP2 domain-containing protein n=1 Tax=Streptococcus pyogenes TaxID=1314 RepID=UPI000DA3F23E|nr:AP2 domain-containing protein [Streptococcus pyogenes]SQE97787.1 AP2 domain protein [Streptococcus pyogenes]HEP1426783.1 AP2 domain-containing protein [Streptococcus pyogenes]
MKTTEIKEIGNVFNNLKVISYAGKNKHNKKLAFCECLLCGAKKNMILTEVRTGKSKSCGCLATIKAKERQMVHGYSGTKVHRAWKGMRQRCTNPNYEHYHRYGGRGITFSDEWNDFQIFLNDMGFPPSDRHQLDRIDNDGNYCKENCRWVLPKENCNNRKTYHNKTGFTGVTENTSKKGRYSAVFHVNRKHIQVGTFDSPLEAYRARVNAIKKYNKEHNTNLKYIEVEDL